MKNFTLAVCGLAILSCGKTDAPRYISLGTAPSGGAFFVVGGAIAQTASAAPGNHWVVTAEATKGTQENIRRIAKGELEFALANASISYFAVRGEEGWDASQPIASVMTLAPNVAMFITPSASGIQSIGDLRGKRVCVGPAGAGFEFFIKPLLKAHGLTYDDFTPLNNTQDGAVAMLGDGSADAAFLGGAVPTASITQACASQDITFIPFDDTARTQLIEAYPFFHAAVVPAGTYRGQDQAFAGLNVGSMHLITSQTADEDMVYQFTKAIYENRDAVTQRHPAGKAINPKNAARNLGIPYHPGAVRFYREIGIWPEP